MFQTRRGVGGRDPQGGGGPTPMGGEPPLLIGGYKSNKTLNNFFHLKKSHLL